MKHQRTGRLRLGDFEIDLRTGECLRTGDGQRILLRQQPSEVLRILIEAEGEIVTRQDIKKRLWPNDTIVNFDHSMNVAMGILRRTLGDSAGDPKYIETVARRGYRLRVAVQWLDVEKAPAVQRPPSYQLPAGLIGARVSHYRVLEFIGAGGMGVVYKAEDLKLARRVALKFLPEELANDPLALKRLQREAQTASALNHPNICTIYAIDEYEGQPFIAMELLEGHSLLARLAATETNASSLGSLLDIAIQICTGLQAAHDEGIIHRDIKPGNLFLTRRGQAKILDFGLAQTVAAEEPVAERMTEGDDACSINSKTTSDNKSARIPAAVSVLSRSEVSMGTTGYLSPEQLRKERLDPRTDLFSFGIVLYEMTTGRHPFQGDSLATVHEATLPQSALPAHDLNPAVPRRLSALIAKAMEKDRSRRYQTAAELRADLEDVRHQRKPTATHTSKWLFAGAALFATLVLAIAILWWFHSPASLSPNETVVIGIHNQTRDPAFNDALYVPLSIALEQTPYFTVLPLTKAATAFSELHLSGDPMKLSPQTARQVCVQTNSKLVIAGSVVEAGNGFGVELQAIDCQSGKTIATASGEARSRAQVVHALGLIAVELRARLGEPKASVAMFNKPLDAAASASPEALQMLLEGYKRNLVLDIRGAVSNYQRALALDPNLAAALTSLAAAQDALGDDASAVAAITKAYELRDRLTDPVRFHAESLYYKIVTGESEKECAVLSKSVQRFPDDFISHTNFRVCLLSVGQLDRALAEAREASRLYPSDFSYHSVLFLEILTDRLDEAEATISEGDAQRFDSLQLHYDRALLAALQHDDHKMQEQWRWAEGKPEADYLMLYQRALTEAYHGRYRNFRSLSARAKELAIKENTLVQSSWITNNDALTEAEAGNISEALDLAERGITGPQYRTRQPILALAFARAGRTTRAEELAESINKSGPLHTVVQNYVLPTIQAVIRIQAKDPAGAIKLLERTKQYDFAYPDSFRYLYPSYIRGLAYLQIGEWSLAKIEFQKLVDHPGMVGLSVIGALSHLQLARALKLSGDAAAAGKAYEDFLSLWKNADPDIPIYQQAKAEYARIR
jgi:eukaryotic-like serine/threonine-protein kinase